MKHEILNIAIVITIAAILFSSCKDSSVENQKKVGLDYHTDKSEYYFSSSSFKDTIWCSIYNGTDSTIKYWFPASKISFKDSTGNWRITPITSLQGVSVNPIKPGDTFKSFVFIYQYDSLFFPGVYSFSGEANWTGLTGDTTVIRSNSFTISIK